MRNPEEETTRWRKEKREKKKEKREKRISKEWNPIVVGGESWRLFFFKSVRHSQF